MIQMIMDVLWAGQHSRYFNQTRSFYLFRRIRWLAGMLVVLEPAWIWVDQLLLPDSAQLPIAIGRITTSLACLMLASWSVQPYRMRMAWLRLLLLILLLSAFQSYSNGVLLALEVGQEVAGYHFFPFMIISMLAIFPLTLLEVSVLVVLVVAIELLTQSLTGTLGTIVELNDLWLLGVLGAIAGWASLNQLNMLLGLYRQAARDPLTGLANRRQVLEQLELDIQQAQAKQQPLAVLMMDLDKFKSFNDHHGHAAGDLVLKSFAKILRRHCRRRQDLAGRIGGEEFLLVLPGMDASQAAGVAERICQGCRQTVVTIPTGEQVSFTTSIGVAERFGADQSELLRQADEALYQAKDEGRDCVRIASKSHDLLSQSGLQRVSAGHA
ncbi:GGDEF domain-containing protein [Balneatrix alpica]|uniref:diguanylate cyclase n=1 Tax=Balneatrix alpica TaxID=75684 RepID=A0ABV5ZC24_9GAMM|nr:GGDEF domain-containing protein [Balneatrix alpica]